MSTRYPRTVGYFLPLGALASAAVVAFALSPLAMAGIPSLVVVALSIILDRSTRSLGTRAQGAAEVAHLVIAGSAFVVALILAATIARADLYWVSLFTATAVFVLIAGGGWMCERQRLHKQEHLA